MHKLESVEVYHYYAGAPAKMLLLDSSGKVEEPVLGSDLDSGHRPQIIVEPGVWQGSKTTGEWTLLGTTMAPPYSQEMFQLADREELLKGWPDSKEKIYESRASYFYSVYKMRRWEILNNIFRKLAGIASSTISQYQRYVTGYVSRHLVSSVVNVKYRGLSKVKFS